MVHLLPRKSSKIQHIIYLQGELICLKIRTEETKRGKYAHYERDNLIVMAHKMVLFSV